jgi:hypothetical protein
MQRLKPADGQDENHGIGYLACRRSKDQPFAIVCLHKFVLRSFIFLRARFLFHCLLAAAREQTGGADPPSIHGPLAERCRMGKERE